MVGCHLGLPQDLLPHGEIAALLRFMRVPRSEVEQPAPASFNPIGAFLSSVAGGNGGNGNGGDRG